MRRKHLVLMWLGKRLPKEPVLMLLIGALLFSPMDLKRDVLAASSVDNNCFTQAIAQINKVRYLGKDSAGRDQVEVNWLVHSVSECVPFGGGQDVPGKSSESVIQPFGYEITVKIKRRLG